MNYAIIRDTVFQLSVAMDRLSTCTVASSIQTRHSFTKERNTGKTVQKPSAGAHHLESP